MIHRQNITFIFMIGQENEVHTNPWLIWVGSDGYPENFGQITLRTNKSRNKQCLKEHIFELNKLSLVNKGIKLQSYQITGFNIFARNQQLHPGCQQNCNQSNQEHMEMLTFFQ